MKCFIAANPGDATQSNQSPGLAALRLESAIHEGQFFEQVTTEFPDLAADMLLADMLLKDSLCSVSHKRDSGSTDF